MQVLLQFLLSVQQATAEKFYPKQVVAIVFVVLFEQDFEPLSAELLVLSDIQAVPG